MSDRMDRFHVFESKTAPAAFRFCGNFLGTTIGKDGKVRPDWEPIVFRGATAEHVRTRAAAWVAEHEAKAAEAKLRAEERRAREIVRRAESRAISGGEVS